MKVKPNSISMSELFQKLDFLLGGYPKAPSSLALEDIITTIKGRDQNSSRTRRQAAATELAAMIAVKKINVRNWSTRQKIFAFTPYILSHTHYFGPWMRPNFYSLVEDCVVLSTNMSNTLRKWTMSISSIKDEYPDSDNSESTYSSHSHWKRPVVIVEPSYDCYDDFRYDHFDSYSSGGMDHELCSIDCGYCGTCSSTYDWSRTY
ncbi:hypothetical protein RCL1_002179 [Eukaryota sp. TZLM3-RCL]